jgi:hypothetical protein
MIDRTNIKQYLLDHSIEKAGPLATPCLVWTGNCNFEGYGSCVMNVAHKKYIALPTR